MGSQIARVRERASSWVLLYKTLMGSKGKGRGKLASDREGSVKCHMRTQFCLRVWLVRFSRETIEIFRVLLKIIKKRQIVGCLFVVILCRRVERPNIWGTTLFYCVFEWVKGEPHYFTIYDFKRDGKTCINCRWLVYASGPCLQHSETSFTCFPWNKNASELKY
uniref:Uncharacterized protein n=1 Tax=Cucumis melo TaxID=3656 RepID=A0A9I9EBP9_CUCME